MTILFAPASKHPQDLRSLVAQPMMRFLFSLQALFDGCKGILPCLWPTGRYRLRHPSFLMYSRQNGAGRMKREISDSPKTCSGSQACAHSSPASLTLLCCLFSSVISSVVHDSARSTPPLQTLHIDSLLIIYRAGRRVCRASSQVLLSIMDGWSYHPCTQSGNDICKKSSNQISLLSAGSGAVEVAARSTIIKSQ